MSSSSVSRVDPREDRLPKWAQEQLRSLRYQLDRAQTLNAELRGEVGETNTHVLNYSAPDQPLSNGASVQFRLGDRFDQCVTARIERDRLTLHGGKSLIVHPNVSNSISVSLGDR